MLLEDLIAEIKYYTGKRTVDKQEAEEILGVINDNPSTDIEEIIAEYYSI